MFKIGEFSKLTQVSIRMLRFYDEMGLLKPAYTDASIGYRMYDAKQIPQLQKIIMLRDCKFTTTEIREILTQWDEESIVRLLNKKREEILAAIKVERQRVHRIDTAICDIQSQQLEYQYHIQFKQVPSYKVLSLRRTVEDYFQENQLWQELCQYVNEHQIEVATAAYNNLSIYHELEESCDGVDIEIAIVVPKLLEAELPFSCYETQELPLVAYMMVYGPYERLGKAYEQVALWLNEHEEYVMYGCSRQVSHKGPGEGVCSEEYLTEIQIPVHRKAL